MVGFLQNGVTGLPVFSAVGAPRASMAEKPQFWGLSLFGHTLDGNLSKIMAY
jgi:hypothetical protein